MPFSSSLRSTPDQGIRYPWAGLGESVAVFNRVIAYYEQDEAQPPGPMLVDLVQAIQVSTDDLLGIRPIKDKTSPNCARLLNRLRRYEDLPVADQKPVLKVVDALLKSRPLARSKGSRRRR